MTATFFNRFYKDVRKKMMGPFDSRVVCGERAVENRESFVGFLQIFSDKTATTLKITALVTYPPHAILLNVSLRQWYG